MGQTRVHSRKRGCLIVCMVLIVIACAVWFIGRPVANTQVAAMLEPMLEHLLADPAMPKFDYQQMRVDAVGGKVILDAVSIDVGDGLIMAADTVELTVRIGELVGYGLKVRDGLSTAQVRLQGLVGTKEGMLELSAAEVVLDVDGLLDPERPQRAKAYQVAVKASQVGYGITGQGLRMQVERLEALAEGQLDLQSFEQPGLTWVKELGSIDFSASEGKLMLSDSELSSIILATAWLSDQRDRTFRQITVKAAPNTATVTIGSLVVDSRLISLSGEADIPFEFGSLPLNVFLNVSAIDDRLRADANSLIGLLGIELPARPFELTFGWDGVGLPMIDIE